MKEVTCIDCGATFSSERANALRCEACSVKRRAEYHHAYSAGLKSSRRDVQKKPYCMDEIRKRRVSVKSGWRGSPVAGGFSAPRAAMIRI